MPWWVIIYFIAFIIYSIVAIWGDYRDRQPIWFLVCAILSNLFIFYLFFIYWQPLFRIPMGVIAPIGFVIALSWEIFQLIQDVRIMRNDSDNSKLELYLILSIAVVIILPVFIIAGIAAFK